MHRQPCAAVLFGMGALAALLVLLAGSPALAIRAGITIDVHQDADLKPGQLPNDFHIEGRVCSSNGTPPVLVDHIDDVFADPDGVSTAQSTSSSRATRPTAGTSSRLTGVSAGRECARSRIAGSFILGCCSTFRTRTSS